MSFVHLHCHSEYSLLDGANRIDDLISRANEFEQPALAITDHGNMHAAWEFQEKARKAGIKPLIGMEAYVAPGSRHIKERDGARKPYYHLVLLARNEIGYKNLIKLSSLGYTEGFYSRPRVDRELLARYNEGIIVSSACMAGEVAVNLLNDNWDAARETASWYANTFKDYYLEVQAHNDRVCSPIGDQPRNRLPPRKDLTFFPRASAQVARRWRQRYADNGRDDGYRPDSLGQPQGRVFLSES